jgi:hemoglobin
MIRLAAAGCTAGLTNIPTARRVLLRMDLLDTQVYGMIGDEGFARLVAAFYRRVPADGILGPMYEGRDLGDAEWRLREFLVGRFGGPGRYVERRGHPRLKMRHHPFAINAAARDRWVGLMSAALDEVQLPPQAVPLLRRFFEDAATFLINQP